MVFKRLIFDFAGTSPGAINGTNQTGGNSATKNRKFYNKFFLMNSTVSSS